MMGPYDERTGEEKLTDEKWAIHQDGDCDGAPWCDWCQDAVERGEESSGG